MARIIITGGSGIIGTRLSELLLAGGHEVVALSRDPSRHAFLPGVQGVRWDAQTAEGWGRLASGAYAIVNLAGETIGGSRPIPLPGTWNKERKRRIKESRIFAGQAIVAAVAAAAVRPRVVFQMSGIDYYPPAAEEMTEESGRGWNFLSEVVADCWEPSTAPVEALGVRRIVARTAPLLSLKTGPLPASLIQFRLFAGGRLGSGQQWFSWIHAEDAVRAIKFLIESESAQGVYNVASPEPVTNAEFAKILGRVMRRPSFLPVPAFLLKLMLGEVSSLVLDGRRVSVDKLQGLGFDFRFSTLQAALRDTLGN